MSDLFILTRLGANRTAVARRALAAALAAALATAAGAADLREARRGFATRLLRQVRDSEPLAPPPPALFSLVHYSGPAGQLSAYVGTRPAGRKRPAMVWITGGFPVGGIDSDAWTDVSRDNDQSAKAYRLAGLVMMYPTVRGAAGNGGVQEQFYGEVDDVLAAIDWLRRQPGVDANRTYLGGHSTGATLALLAAEAGAAVRAIVAFGPVEDVTGYGSQWLPFDANDPRELGLRAPGRYLDGIRAPTFVIEGTGGNIASLRALRRANRNPLVSFLEVRGATHFDVLAPANDVIAALLARDTGAALPALEAAALQAAFDRERAGR